MTMSMCVWYGTVQRPRSNPKRKKKLVVCSLVAPFFLLFAPSFVPSPLSLLSLSLPSPTQNTHITHTSLTPLSASLCCPPSDTHTLVRLHASPSDLHLFLPLPLSPCFNPSFIPGPLAFHSPLALFDSRS
ncbi:unnamed protein product [Mortierella alpina]